MRLGEHENEDKEEEALQPGNVEPRPKAKGKAKAKGKSKSKPKAKAKGKAKSQAPDTSEGPITTPKKARTGLVAMTPDGNEESEDSCEKELQHEDLRIKEDNRIQKKARSQGSPKRKKVQRRLDAELEEAAKDCAHMR